MRGGIRKAGDQELGVEDIMKDKRGKEEKSD